MSENLTLAEFWATLLPNLSLPSRFAPVFLFTPHSGVAHQLRLQLPAAWGHETPRPVLDLSLAPGEGALGNTERALAQALQTLHPSQNASPQTAAPHPPKEEAPAALWWLDLSTQASVQGDAAAWNRLREQVLTRLNVMRTQLERDLNAPLVIVLPETVDSGGAENGTTWRRRASYLCPDIWHIRIHSSSLPLALMPALPPQRQVAGSPMPEAKVDATGVSDTEAQQRWHAIMQAERIPTDTETEAACADWLAQARYGEMVVSLLRWKERLHLAQPAVPASWEIAAHSSLGQAYSRLAQWELAERHTARALQLSEALYGPEHPTVAIGLNNLASVLESTNRLARAEPLYRRALAISEATYGEQHPTVAAGLNNLAGLLQATNRLAEAEPLFRRALAIDEASYGENLPTIAIGLNNLAFLLKATNRLAEAEPLYWRALAINEASYGEHHPVVAIGVNNLATLMKTVGRVEEAEPLFRRALTIDEASYGEHHPAVATDLNNLASLLESTSRMAEAEPLYRRALAITEASYGEHHPTVATCLNNLAGLLRSTKRLAEAEPLYRLALAINEASYGEHHPSLATVLNNLAGLLRATNRLAAAEPLFRRALAIDEASYGEHHPSVAGGLNNLAGLLYATKRLAEAEPLFRRALTIFVDFTLRTGHTHPHLRDAVANYLILLQAMKLPADEAREKLQTVLAPLQADPRFHDLALSLLPPTE